MLRQRSRERVSAVVSKMLATTLAGAMLFAPAASGAEKVALALHTGKNVVLAERGDWRLYHVDAYHLAVGTGERVVVGGSCIAEAVDDGVRLHLVTLVPTENTGRKSSFGGVVMQMSSPDWSYPASEANLTLLAGGLGFLVTGTLYDVDTVNFNLGGASNLADTIAALVALGGDSIDIRDYQETEIARMPTEGLLEIFDDMLSCSAI